MSFNDERPGWLTWHPVAGDGPHGGGSVVDVVGATTVVDVELVEDELLVVEVLLVVDVVLVVDVLLLVLLDDDVVVVGGPPISQFVPEMPGGQMQRYVPDVVARQVPPLKHGPGVHASLGSVVVVVVPAVHVDEPGGADVPGAQGAHTDADPVENVLAGHSRQAAAPAAAKVPAGQAGHDVAPAPPALVPAAHGAHEVAPALAANVPGKQYKHGRLPDALDDPGGQGVADVGTAYSRLTSCAVLRSFCTVLPAAHGPPPQVHRPVGIASRLSRSVSSRSWSWFS